MGNLAQRLILRIEMHESETFVELLQRVHREFRAAWEHTDFNLVIPRLSDIASRSTPAIFEWFPWQPKEPTGSGTPGWAELNIPLEVRPLMDNTALEVPPKSSTSMVLFCYNSAQGIDGHGFYRTDVFAPRTLDRFVRNLRVACGLLTRNSQVQLKLLKAALEAELPAAAWSQPTLAT